MTKINHFTRSLTSFAAVLATAFALGLLSPAAAQTESAQATSLEVEAGVGRAEFVARGRLYSVSVEVYAPSGEMVFQSAPTAVGQAVVWDMTDEQGNAVADGVYIATITMHLDSGKLRKRIEQIIVNRESGASAPGKPETQSLSAEGPTPQAVGTISGQGTLGKVAKFTGTNDIGDSVITESVGKVGVNISPTSVLQVNGVQPPPLAISGTNATMLLQTSGGRGGETTGTSGQKGGAGASISLLAGSGGNAVAGSTNGVGGNITLQPGSPGTGGAGGVAGNVLVAPKAGSVGVGTATPASKLTVSGGDIQITTSGKGLKFPDGSLQTKAAVSGLSTVSHDTTLTGTGTSASPLKVASSLSLSGNGAFGGTLSAGTINFTGLRTQANANSPNVIGGHSSNSVTANVVGATIAGGGRGSSSEFNRVTDDFSTVGGGAGNTAGNNDATVTTNFFATVGGGVGNKASAGGSTVGGGAVNTANGPSSTVGGGTVNVAAGESSTVPGGENNIAAGKWSFAAGINAKAAHAGTFVWSDSTGENSSAFSSTASDQFLISAGGGVGINTNSPQSALQVNGYIQLALTSGVPPPADCDAAPEYGRMKVDAVNKKLWVCTNAGWKSTTLN